MTRVASFNFVYDYSPVLLWQYSNSPKLKAIIDNEQKFINTAITQFCYESEMFLYKLDTCNADGLDLWGRLLGIQRPVADGVQFTDDQYRLLLKSRMLLINWDGSSYGLTRVIRGLFPEAVFRVVDNGNMIVNIDFASGVSESEKVVLSMGYVDEVSGEYVYTFLPRPAGVEYNISYDDTWATTLGFEGMTETTNMGGAYDCDPDDHTGETGTENADGGVFYK